MSKENRYNDIGEDEIRIIGNDKPRTSHNNDTRQTSKLLRVGVAVAAIALIAVVALVITSRQQPQSKGTEQAMPAILNDDIPSTAEPALNCEARKMSRIVHDTLDTNGFVELRDTSINDVALRIYIPHNATMSLHVGKMNRDDSSVIYAAEASFIRDDNHAILGAYVLKGKPLAWGLSLRGYCAVIEDKVTVGVADNSPLFEEATEKGGYFFRQYPLVDNGEFVKNEPKNKAIRRAICTIGDEVFMVESLNKESFYDFTQALVDLGVENGVNLAGSHAYGWAVDREGTRHEFGTPYYYTGQRRMPKNTNYIVWRKK
jgi:hypothetical protein